MKENAIEWLTGDQVAKVKLSQQKYINRIRRIAKIDPDSVGRRAMTETTTKHIEAATLYTYALINGLMGVVGDDKVLAYATFCSLLDAYRKRFDDSTVREILLTTFESEPWLTGGDASE